jgi:hypothetical protein
LNNNGIIQKNVLWKTAEKSLGKIKVTHKKEIIKDWDIEIK